jgi:hypothetical protein
VLKKTDDRPCQTSNVDHVISSRKQRPEVILIFIQLLNTCMYNSAKLKIYLLKINSSFFRKIY